MIMKRMLNRMLRYADAIVKRGVDKLIDVIAHSAEPQTKNTVTPQRKKRMRNDTDCAPQTAGSTTNCAPTPTAKASGMRATRLKSSMRVSSAMPNIRKASTPLSTTSEVLPSGVRTQNHW